MARESHDREDLMAEVITYSPRVALVIPDYVEEIVAGRRSDGRWSVFFGGDPVYHFDSDGRLRRAFVHDELYRSQGQTLCRLKRQVTATETTLLRHDLEKSELEGFRVQCCDRLNRLSKAISRRDATIQQLIPENVDFLPELARLIQVVLDSGCILAEAVKRGG